MLKFSTDKVFFNYRVWIVECIVSIQLISRQNLAGLHFLEISEAAEVHILGFMGIVVTN